MSVHSFNHFTYHMPTKVIFGTNKLIEVGRLVKPIGSKVLLVTGRRSMKVLGVTDRVISLLEKESLQTTIFDGVEPNPPCEMADDAAHIVIEKGIDVIIGLGGGSAMDTAKTISVVASHGGQTWDYMGVDTVSGPIIPIIAIPTTSGSGSEVIAAAVISNKATKKKEGIVSPYLFPVIAIVDPSLMVSVPASVTADSGLDTLAHAIESYCARAATPISNPLALQAIRLVKTYLGRAVKNGQDRQAREGMALACVLAGMAVAQTGVGAAHGFGMSIGGLLDTPHGRAVGILLPQVMEYNAPSIPEKLRKIAMGMGRVLTGNLHKDAQQAVKATREILREIGFPMRLAAIGVKRDMVDQIVKNRDLDDISNNPRPFTTEEAVEFLNAII